MQMQLNFLNGVPYVPLLQQAVWRTTTGKVPNPPYVFFKYDRKAWKRMPLAEFPPVFKESNVTVSRPDPDHREGLLTVDIIKEENRLLEPYLRQLMRDPWRVPTCAT